MPEQPLLTSSPAQAARTAVSRALVESPQVPLLYAASLLIAACREADRRDPAWRGFLQALSEAEVEFIVETATQTMGVQRPVSFVSLSTYTKADSCARPRPLWASPQSQFQRRQ